MHPAKSVIFFTTASGAGYGLMVWLAVLGIMGLVPIEMVFGLVAFAVSFMLIVAGLLSSTFHLGHPERAWRALSQWKTSWLSREGVAAVLAFAPMGLFALSWVFMDLPMWGKIMGVAGGIMALVTVYTTSMIYGSLKSIPAWHNGMTSPGYLVLSLATGAVLAAALCGVFGYDIAPNLAIAAAAAIGIGLLIKLAYWSGIDNSAPVSTAESATGLGKFGKVRLIEGPHTEANYLLEEMGFKIARKHSQKLRSMSAIAFILCSLFCAIAGFLLSGVTLTIALIAAVIAGIVAIVVERWLFFAEAKHVVTLYYGTEAA